MATRRIQAQVPGEVYLAHTPGAQAALDLVMAELLPNHEVFAERRSESNALRRIPDSASPELRHPVHDHGHRLLVGEVLGRWPGTGRSDDTS